MIELPEAQTLAKQLNRKTKGKKISSVTAASSPHKLAWYHGDPKKYHNLIKGKTIKKAAGVGGIVEIRADTTIIALSDGAAPRFHDDEKTLPKKHQLLMEFEDKSFLSVSIQMYGGILCFPEGRCDNEYYAIAKEKPSPLSVKFNEKYFHELISLPDLQSKSAKFFLATEQRVPGLGNGVLQDILFMSKIHPKRKIETLSDKEKKSLFNGVKAVLKEMTDKGGRDTEKDLFGMKGGYVTKLSKNTLGNPCLYCKTPIKKESYMGGAIYFCERCQSLK
jgi:formamidopyrimidine-DNA glycosylase